MLMTAFANMMITLHIPNKNDNPAQANSSPWVLSSPGGGMNVRNIARNIEKYKIGTEISSVPA